MPQGIDKRALDAFFKEVEEQVKLNLKYHPENKKFPIQVEGSTDGISKIQCNKLLEFIEGQVDLRDNEIAQLTSSKIAGKVIVEITEKCTKKLSEVYSLSLFYDASDDSDNE